MRFLPIFLFLVATATAEEARTWTGRNGQTFTAQLLACDAVRATLDVAGRGKLPVPLSALSPADLEYIARWRESTPNAPLIDPSALAPWPAQVATAPAVVRQVEDDAAGKKFAWESAHFRIGSDLKLPQGIIRDLATVFEATREVIMNCPLGLHTGTEREKYEVRMFFRPVDYLYNGGAAGSGGYFNGKETLLLLPNLGIKASTNGLTAEHAKNLFVLKHEITHHLLRPAGWKLPVWLDEGLAECVASWPYTQGRYALQSLDAAMHDYVLKWRKPNDRTKLRIIAPAKLMDFSVEDWRKQVSDESAYDHYNSAALLTHYFLFKDGRGDSAGVAAFLEAIRRGTPAEEAEAQHLLKGRTRADLAGEVQALAKRLSLEIALE